MKYLNARQEAFCNYVVAGHTVTEAYKLSGYTAKHPRECAYHLRKMPKILERIEELQKTKMEKMEKDYKITRDTLIDELGKIIYGSSKDRDKISAIQVVAKLLGYDVNINANIKFNNINPEELNIEELQKYIQEKIEETKRR